MQLSDTGAWLITSQYSPTAFTVSRNWSKSTGFSFAPFGANEHAQACVAESEESSLVGQVVPQVGDGDIRTDFIQDGANSIAFIATFTTSTN